MGLQLTRGGESRLDGAPYQDLPGYADYVDSVAARLLAEDTDGLLANDREMARERARMIVNAELEAEQKKRAEAQAQVTEDYGRRQKDRAQARGVDPETMPYGASASDVRLANRPVDEASAQLDMEQNAADRVVRGLREGTPTFEDQEDLNFLRERGDQNPLAGPGKTDMAMRGAIRERRGQYYEMPDGTRIPVGREPTAAEIRAEREWQDWTNENPGTERQARYAPADYAAWQEARAQEIRDRAQWEQMTYGTSGLDVAGNPIPMSDAQKQNRAARKASEARVRVAQRGKFYEQKLQNETGMPPGTPIPVMEAERFRQRDAARTAELKSRRDNLRNQRLLLAPGGRGVANAINMLPPGWREIAILDRLTDGRRGGATPLDVDAMGAQNAFRMMQGMELGQGFLNNPAVQQQVQNAQLQQQADVLADAETHVNDNYAWDRGWMGASSFTAAEQQQTIDYLMNKYGPPAGRMTLAQAQAIVDQIAARKIQEPATPPAVPDAGGPPMM